MRHLKNHKFSRLNVYLASVIFLITACTFKAFSQETKNQNMEKKDIVLEYSDGNANIWIIRDDSIFYKPVIPIESSSGIYSGGKIISKKILSKDFKSLLEQFEEIFKNEAIQIPNRVMTSGLLSKSEDGKPVKLVIIKNCPEQERLESILNRNLK
jgi:hypothetical protein